LVCGCGAPVDPDVKRIAAVCVAGISGGGHSAAGGDNDRAESSSGWRAKETVAGAKFADDCKSTRQ
jgi:hypothetical protein